MPAGGGRRPLAGAVILAAAMAWSGWLGLLHLGGEASVADLVEEPLTDLRTRLAGPAAPPAEVVIVAIDDATVTAEGGYPLDRRRIALLLDRIRARGAKTLAIDILFVDPADAPANAALATALSAGPTVIAAAGRFSEREARSAAVPLLADELRPLPAFEAAADVGLANVAVGAAGTPRHLPLLFLGAGGIVQGFALRAAALQRSADPIIAGESVGIGGLSVPLDLRWHLPIRFYGPAGSIRTISADAFLSEDGTPPRLDGVVAVVGVTATAVGDTFGTPFDGMTPGVEIQATGIAALLGGEGLVRDPAVRRTDAALAMLVAVGGTLAILLVPLTRSLPAAGLGLVGLFAVQSAVFAAGIWTSAALPLVASLPPFAAAAFRRQNGERRKARASEGAETALRRFQSLPIAERIAGDPSYLSEPVEQRAAVLFTDISGFSGRSEIIGPSRTQDLLKAFHTLVVDTVEAHGGIVMNFMGDGAMIVFGVVETAPDPAGRAFRAASELCARTLGWLDGEARDGGGLGIRLGLHFGPVILSRLGHEHQQQISVSGNTVNLASRLMEVAKGEGAVMAASRPLMDAIETADGRDGGMGEPDAVRPVDIRGLRESVTVALWKRPPSTRWRPGDGG